MSGGVDSSLVAALLCQQGHDVIGVTLQLYDYETSLEDTDPSKRHCHPLAFIQDARQVAQDLGIPHHVLSHQHIFQSEIIDPFIQSYQQGKTPLPCAKCNRDVKTAALYAMMQEFGADAMATGHYVRRIDVDGQVQIHQGQDPLRDQSFFLFALNTHYFDKMIFPLGAYSKAETRAKALELGLPVADTPASQDLCFIAKKSYKTLFDPIPGDMIHIDDGRILGQHQGVTGFTIGQRQGLGIGGQKESLHVVGLDVAKNQVLVGPRHHLACSVIHLDQVNWLAPELCAKSLHHSHPSDPQNTHHPVRDNATELPFRSDGPSDNHPMPRQESKEDSTAHLKDILVKIRSSSRAVPAKIHLYSEEPKAILYLETPDYSISPGQACVFYQGTRLLGGGWISEHTKPDNQSSRIASAPMVNSL